MPAPWIVLHEGRRLRWGGDLRRHHLLLELARRTGADLVDGWSPGVVRSAIKGRVVPRWQPWRPRACLASAEMLSPSAVRDVAAAADPILLDVHDDPLAQHAAFGIAIASERSTELRALREANLGTFRWLAAPTASFAELARLDRSRVLVAPNGTDTRHVRPLPFPNRPALGMISGAAPRRGIETLVDAARIVRTRVPDLRLLLWLIATGADSESFLADLRGGLAAETWIEIGSAPYAELGERLGQAAVLCVPHPAGEYMDVALPVKLLDSMAAGRPVVVTPRREMRSVVETHSAGLVAGADSPEALAEPIVRLLEDADLAARLGAAGRAAAESTFDWRVVGGRLADAVLERTR